MSKPSDDQIKSAHEALNGAVYGDDPVVGLNPDLLMPTLDSNEELRAKLAEIEIDGIPLSDLDGGYFAITEIMQLIKADREAAIREAEASFEWRDKNARLQELLDLENNGEQRIPAYLKKRIRRLRQQLISLNQPTKEGNSHE